MTKKRMALGWTKKIAVGKLFLISCVTILSLSACSTNPATGQQQFTALMPESQEAAIGASEHRKIITEFGGPFPNYALEAYVNEIGRKVAANTERSGITYRFFILDTPDVNAFALPGGYVYVTRGLLALANSEDELAGVLGHEIGHITARHAAERYSQNVLTGVGLAVLSAAVETPGLTKAMGMGSDLAMKSYSRSQEIQADELGVRYLARAGYDPLAVAGFLAHLDAHTRFERQSAKKGATLPDYLSTHPNTGDRVAQAAAFAGAYQPVKAQQRDAYLRRIEGVGYGDSARQGFLRGRTFIHPDLGFQFVFPPGMSVQNTPKEVTAVGDDGTAVIFDGVKNPKGLDPQSYLQDVWIPGEKLQQREPMTINGLRAATGSYGAMMHGRPAMIRVVAVAWSPQQIFRFQIALPDTAGPLREKEMRQMVYSLRPMTPDERAGAATLTLHLVTARVGDTADTLARQMVLGDGQENAAALFRVLNGLTPREPVVAGRAYKVVR